MHSPATIRRLQVESRERLGISVFFPAYNDAPTIGALVTEALKILPTLTDDFEVIVINDGSTDGTRAKLDALSNSHPEVRVIHHSSNEGYGAALRSGFSCAQKISSFIRTGTANMTCANCRFCTHC